MDNKLVPQQTHRLKVFDPRIIEKDSNQRLWTTESVLLANNGLENGYDLIDNPYNQRIKDVKLRKASLAFQYTQEELITIKKCMKSRIYFGNNFISLKDGDKGWQRITLRDYQKDVLKKYRDNRFNILMFPRQSGKTTTTIIQIVWFLTFNKDKDCVVIAQSDKVVNEILTKIREAFSSLPFYMQPGFITFTKKGLTLDNGCRLSIGVASESVVQGFSLDLLFIDEFAYIRESLVNKFWNNIYPSLTNNPNSRCIIASTPNGRNKFYDLWTGAVNQTNSFVNSRVYWWDVPRTVPLEDFKRETIENVGMDGWLMGYECSFDVGLKSVFHTTDQTKLREWQRDCENKWKPENDIIGVKFDNFRFLDKSEFEYNTKTDYFIISSDIGEGLEQDSTTMKINKIYWSVDNKRLEYRQVGVFSSNEIAIEDFAILALEVIQYFDRSKIKYVVENNTYGGEFFQKVKNLILYDTRFRYMDRTFFAKFVRNSKNDYEYGIRWNEDNKKVGVKSFSKLVHKGVFRSDDFQTIEEYLNFGRQKNDSYQANYGHDDLVMSDVTASYYICNNDVFVKAFLSSVEYQLRALCNDITDEEKQKIDEEKKLLNKNTIKIYKEDNRKLVIRDHEKAIKDLESGKTFHNMIDDWSINYTGNKRYTENNNSVILI